MDLLILSIALVLIIGGLAIALLWRQPMHCDRCGSALEQAEPGESGARLCSRCKAFREMVARTPGAMCPFCCLTFHLSEDPGVNQVNLNAHIAERHFGKRLPRP